MYYPYLRAKQNELILLRDNVELLKNNKIHPIIEPVKKNIRALNRALNVLIDENIQHTVIINPQVGEHKYNNSVIKEFLLELIDDEKNQTSSIGVILHADSRLEEIRTLLFELSKYPVSLIHYGFSDAESLKIILKDCKNIKKHIFIENHTSILYQRQFSDNSSQKIIVRDGFKMQKKNANYPFSEHFSDLHITYNVPQGFDGFGDFLIVGDEFRESGGPAYAVAIHLTYIDKNRYNDMFIHHFISDTVDTPTDPGGKFMQALKKLVVEVNKPDSSIFKSFAVAEYIDLYNNQHFPGLGYVKKLSMQHHLELIAHYMRSI